MPAQIEGAGADSAPAAARAAGVASARADAPDVLPEALLERVIVALVAEEFGRIRGRAVGPAEWTLWTAETRLDEDASAGDAPCPALGADSLARLEIIARVNRFFHMHETGAEDYLVVRPTFGEWRDIVAASLGLSAERITFLTGGTTGAPKPMTHAMADLAAEADGQTALLGDAASGRVISLVPPHHIYGFLWGGLAPARRGVDVIDARAWGPTRAAAEAQPGDVVVATPFLWALMLRGGARFGPGVTGVTSTAPAPAELWDELSDAGLARLIEIYGSSETGGLGWRDASGAALTPLPHLFCENATLSRRRDGAVLTPPDRLHWTTEGGFLPAGRLDGAVQVGGVNVSCDAVRARLASLPGVSDAAVRLDGGGAGARLKALVVPEQGVDAEALRVTIEGWCASALDAPERPARIAFASALPRDAMGKLADWR